MVTIHDLILWHVMCVHNMCNLIFSLLSKELNHISVFRRLIWLFWTKSGNNRGENTRQSLFFWILFKAHQTNVPSLLFICLKKTERVDFSWNPLADPKFTFHDHSLMEAVRQKNPEVQAFFRLLALCHTVMPEERTEGEVLQQPASPLHQASSSPLQLTSSVFLKLCTIVWNPIILR